MEQVAKVAGRLVSRRDCQQHASGPWLRHGPLVWLGSIGVTFTSQKHYGDPSISLFSESTIRIRLAGQDSGWVIVTTHRIATRFGSTTLARSRGTWRAGSVSDRRTQDV